MSDNACSADKNAYLPVYFMGYFCQISGEFRGYYLALNFSSVNSFKRMKKAGL